MTGILRRFLIPALCLVLILGISPRTLATQPEADDISGSRLVSDQTGFPGIDYLFDGKFWSGGKTAPSASLTLTHEGGIGSLYLTFAEAYGAYTIVCNDTGAAFTAGRDLFIHEFVDLEAAFGVSPTSVTLCFDNGPALLYELAVYGPGPVPDSVQKWQHPADGKTDLVLFATHSDDDQLFFLGLLPYYGVERGYRVQVVYLTNHHNTAPFRMHEMLNGLWGVGVRTYPIFGPYEDFGYTRSKEEAFAEFARLGWTREQMTGFVVEQLRCLKPLVAVGHDLKGEYGHAQHQVYAQLLTDAIALSADPAAYPETAETWGVWEVPKTYIHLYEENPIVLDWDRPMESFGGMTPFEVSRDLGFPAHESQLGGWSWYYEGVNTASEITHYSPCRYGLYHSTVGPDETRDDMFEHLISHARQDQLLEEARLEAERLAAEEEAQRLAQQQETEVTTPLETAPTFPEEPIESSENSETTWYFLIIAAAIVPVSGLLLLLRKHKNKKIRKK